MIKRRWALAGLGLLLAAAVLAQDTPQPPPARDDAGVREALHAYWDAFTRQDAARLEQLFDFPLTLVETPGEDGQPGARFVYEQADWPALKREFPPLPAPAETVAFELGQVRLEWFGPRTCLALYQVDGELGKPRGEAFHGQYMTLLVWHERWRVALTTVPQ